ncbi:MAG: hypothetical protein NTX56_19570, partial [Proteobacteria bacterium]|nr:hypothetical protein [Pseudomonadota bacterium]
MSDSLRSLDPVPYLDLANRIEALLDRNGYSAESELLRRIESAIKAGGPLSLLSSSDIWGGSGSVSDCNLLSEAGPQSRQAAMEAHRDFCSLIAQLAKAMSVDGIADPRV